MDESDETCPDAVLRRVKCYGRSFLCLPKFSDLQPRFDHFRFFDTQKDDVVLEYSDQDDRYDPDDPDDLDDLDDQFEDPHECLATASNRAHTSLVEKNNNPHDAVQLPLVVARGLPSASQKCFQCGDRCAWAAQTPYDVFSVGFVVGGGAHGIDCVVKMAKLLQCGDRAAVLERTSVCKAPACLISQGMLSVETYSAWLQSATQRPQLMRGTNRASQTSVIVNNMMLLRVLAQTPPCGNGGPILTTAQVTGLFEHIVGDSQYILEREKKFIATAAAVAENQEAFGYRFNDAQRLVDRMARLPRNYALNVLLPLLLDTGLNEFRWKAKLNLLLDIACPKAPDALFAIMCDINSEAQGRPQTGGRLDHVLRHGQDGSVFTADGFKAGLVRAVAKSPSYTLGVVDGSPTLSSVGGKNAANGQQLLKIVSGKSAVARAQGVATAPTCGRIQRNSQVHPQKRYVGVFLAEGLKIEEAEKRVALFLEFHPTGNEVGFEQLRDGSGLSRPCHALRPIVTAPKTLLKNQNSARKRLSSTVLEIVPVVTKKPRF